MSYKDLIKEYTIIGKEVHLGKYLKHISLSRIEEICEAYHQEKLKEKTERDNLKVLFYFIFSNQIENISKLLNKNPSLISATNSLGETPLHWAARYKRKEIIKILIEEGAYISIKNNEGKTPIDILLEKRF